MFEVDGTSYELKMNMNRVKMVEGVTGRSIMGEWKMSDGLMSLQTIEACFQLCCRAVGAEGYVDQAKGQSICQKYMEGHGYAMCAKEIMEALQADMPFLFLAS